MGQLTAHVVRDIIIDRLAGGAHPVGSKLPTSRALAAEIGSHRNTVAKAYRELANLGLVSVRQGRGTFVVASPDNGNGRPLAVRVREGLTDLVLEARRIGLPEHELRDLLDQRITAAYGSARRAMFVECNRADIESAITEIETLVGHKLAPLTLQQLERDPVSAVAGFDVVFTSLCHVKQVSDLLAQTRSDVDVIGIYTQPDESALDRIARIPPTAIVGIVVSNVEGARRFAHHINTVTAAETRALVRPTDDEIRALAAAADAFVCSRSRLGQVRALQLKSPTIELRFHVSPQSAARLAEALACPRTPALATETG